MKLKAKNTWHEADIIFQEKCYNSAASRYYYAVYQATKAFAEQSDSNRKKKGQSCHAFIQSIVKKYNKSQEQNMRQLYQLRIKADYKIPEINEEELSEHIKIAKPLFDFFTNLNKEKI